MGIFPLLLNIQWFIKLSQTSFWLHELQFFFLLHHLYTCSVNYSRAHLRSDTIVVFSIYHTLGGSAQNTHGRSRFYTRTTRNNLTIHESDCKPQNCIPLNRNFSTRALLTQSGPVHLCWQERGAFCESQVFGSFSGLHMPITFPLPNPVVKSKHAFRNC